MYVSQTRDHEVIAKLNQNVHSLHAKLYPKYFKEYKYSAMKETFKSLVENKSFVFLLLKEYEEPIGYAWIEIKNYPESAFKNEYKSVYVHQLSIAESQTQKGYGKQLMNKIYEIAKKNDIDLIELDYWFENTDAKEFYKKQHFKKYREFAFRQL
ncbi:GNAT family N-acetyltransferase [Peribacillus simplex]|uniref:GNAT family N-acetyltransferase n=1 Tax=Peribacillus simplex TaxID=1478 RepID=UPI000776CF8D|nr:GNAT family N-acetyltransferase [Peribacillus simplex]AMM92690.1 GNAT family acetyltransferase [Peribacillus simplex]MDM5295207.1 GNAT family N-acetyltransferase [Peribacillus simplex]